MTKDVDLKLISIVIPTLGRPSLLATLESIQRCGGSVEVVVCSDSEADRSFLPSISTERVFTSPGSGVNLARNEGARRSRGDIIWFLDDDTEVFHHDAIKMLHEIFTDASIVAAGGEYRSAASSRFAERGYNAFCSVWRSSAGAEDHELLLGGTIAVRRSRFFDAGGFDEHIKYGGAETPFVQRLNSHAAAGERVVFDHRLDVIHRPASRGLSGWARVAIAQGRRKSETARNLPKFRIRISRALKVILRQDLATRASLCFFGIPFIVVSRYAALFRR